MLVPLTREKFEEIIPLIASGPQYAYYWGKVPDFLRRLLISVVAVVIIWLLGKIFGAGVQPLVLILGVIAGLYWFWGPVYWASRRNAAYRNFPYSGFWRGRILDIFITEELISEQPTVNKKGLLEIIETRERRLNLEIGDETGFTVQVQAPLRRIYKVAAPGQIAELLVLSKQPDLSNIAKITDAYIPSQNLWIGEYPYLQRDIFAEVSRRLGGMSDNSNSKSKGYPANVRRIKKIKNQK